jgi:hypothetical protein
MADDFTQDTLYSPEPTVLPSEPPVTSPTSLSMPPAPAPEAPPQPFALPTGPHADVISNAAAAYGVDPHLMYKIAGIESSYNPRASTGSYHGLFQLSNGEFQRYVPGGNIWDASDNANAAAQKTAREIDQFRNTYGREPTPTEVYMQHQQGVGGTAMHLSHPDDRAWVNMYRTGEGQQKGADWARRAITGNMTQSMRRQYNPETITSAQFMEGWRNRVEGPNAQPGGPVSTPQAPPKGMLAQAAGAPPISAPAGGQVQGALHPVMQAESAGTGGSAPSDEEILAAAEKARGEDTSMSDIGKAIERAQGMLQAPKFVNILPPPPPLKMRYHPPPLQKA